MKTSSRVQFIEEEIEVNAIAHIGIDKNVWHIPTIKSGQGVNKKGEGVDIYILDTGE